jgi:CRISPR type IV-associated protein Csf1
VASLFQEVSLKDCISSNFNDFGYFVSKSDYICPECDFCLKDENSLRKINFICNKDFFKKLTKSEALEFIKYPPEPPFYFQVTYSNKKHIFFKGKLNDRKDEFYISTDQGNVLISKKIFFPIYESCLELYNAGFSKKEIASGEFKKLKLIDVFGMEKLLNISNSIDIFRNTQLLQLVLHILQKDGEKEND